MPAGFASGGNFSRVNAADRRSDEHLVPAVEATDAGEAEVQVAASEEPVGDLADYHASDTPKFASDVRFVTRILLTS